MQHTKTPWRIGAGTSTGAVVADEPVAEIGGSDAVEYYGGHLIAESIAPRNAAFIVRACNAHDQLVATLNWAGTALDASRIPGYEETSAEGGGVYPCDGGPFVRRADVEQLMVEYLQRAGAALTAAGAA